VAHTLHRSVGRQTPIRHLAVFFRKRLNWVVCGGQQLCVNSDTESSDGTWERVELRNNDLKTPQGGSGVFELIDMRVIPKRDRKSL
jgi:hypothetical protein